MVPVDGGSARDLRVAADLADAARQLTGLCAAAHRPDARAQTPWEDSLSLFPEGNQTIPGSIRAGISAERPVDSVYRRLYRPVRCPSGVSARPRVLLNLPATVGGSMTWEELLRVHTASA